MTQFKGTPGPWLRDRHGQRRGANGESVIVWDAGIGWGARTEVSEANARLIAAAPALLEALQDCVAWIVDLAESGDTGFWDAEKAPEVIKSRAAIRQATGEGE